MARPKKIKENLSTMQSYPDPKGKVKYEEGDSITLAGGTQSKVKDDNSFLSKEDRDNMLADLKEWGIKDFESLSDTALVANIASCAKEFRSKSESKAVDKLQDQLNSYISAASATGKGDLPNKDMIAKLFNLSVPHFYLHIFRDQDVSMSDKQVWQHIRNSRIRPYNEVKEIFRDKGREAEPLKPHPFENTYQ
jgi:hypothetical protein